MFRAFLHFLLGENQKNTFIQLQRHCKVSSFYLGLVFFPGIHSGPDALSVCLCFGYGCNVLNMSLLNESKSKIQIPRSTCAFSLLPNCFGIFWVSSNVFHQVLGWQRTWDKSACRLRSESKLEKLVLQQVNPKPCFLMKNFSSQSNFGSGSPFAGAGQNIPVNV